MRKIGVGVQGPSDLHFWRKFLHRTFPGRLFDVRNMKNRSKLIHDTPRLLAAFREAGYAGAIIILDLDRDPCVTEVCELFDASVQEQFQRPPQERYLHLCVAIKELESWFLADHEAVMRILPSVQYKLPDDTSIWGAGKFKELWRKQFGERSVAFNKIDVAQRMAPEFRVDRASRHSASLRTAWERIETLVNAV